MQPSDPGYFDQAAATWDENPVRRMLVEAVVESILRRVQITPELDMLDYGCGTGLVSFLLARHVGTVTAADSSTGMLDRLRTKIADSGLQTIRAVALDLERDAVPDAHYDLIVTHMVMHHVADTEFMLRNFHALLWPGDVLCISDLDTEPGVFHDPEAAATVHHHGFDRQEFRSLMERAGFHDVRDTTAHTIRKPVGESGERDFPVFLMTGRR
jgi:2-polyprenyl-3-methyl-5-hydroxy-6-metoxy-1,4-benzoquinol methylase